ncbi:MAG TPA: DUF882 domain-containing protein [Hyphomicrobiaceae bacterium]|nr:DUF882 domain-containing protein [Hyphomicrobiaceae bacterium]
MRARHRASAAAVVVFALGLVIGAAGTNADAQRTLTLYNIHTKETLTSVYKKNGKYVPEEMQKINWLLRDWRKDEATTMDPELVDLLWEIHSELGSKAPIHVISGFRSRTTNEMLRRTVGGQASQSRHILGKAADVHFPDIPLRLLRYSALIREKGGVGYYPTSAIPFVHVDVDRPRAWPRLPRAELALLFPRGHTQHLPDDGVPITMADVRDARAKHGELAAQLAEFHAYRGKPQLPVQTAALTPQLPLPQLLRPPQLAERPAPATTLVSDQERAKLAALAAERPALPRLLAPPALAERPAVYREPQVVSAPAYDEEHPEELSYRPFPIAPLLTVTASADDPALAVMVHPDLGKLLELMDQQDSVPPMRLRPGTYEAELMWAQQSKGVPVDLSLLNDTSGTARSEGRKVATQPQQ